MKKLFAILGLSVLLVGCGGSGTVETKTCTIDLDGAGTMEAKFDATDDKINKTNMKIMMTTEQVGQDLSSLTAEQKDMLATMTIASMGVTEGEGITVDVEIDDKGLAIILDLDFEKADASVLTKLGFESNTNLSLKDLVKEAEASGETCK